LSTLLTNQQLAFIEQCEPSAYHDDGRTGYFAMLWAEGEHKRQRCFPLQSMHFVLNAVDRSRDTWISQAEFFAPTRRIVHLRRLGLCFADLDTYKIPALQALRPQQLLARLLHLCESQGVPTPSLVVFSGRGLQVKWILDSPVPSQALPRWRLVQRELTHRLHSLGSDPASIDPSRVLRLVATTNTKSGALVTILHNTGVGHQFDELARVLLPRGRQRSDSEAGEALCAKTSIHAKRGAMFPDQGAVSPVVQEAANSPRFKWCGATLAWARLSDLRLLAAMRGWRDGAPDTWRDRCVFLSACFLAQALPEIRQLDREVYVLAREFAPHWTAARVADAASSVLNRAKATREAAARQAGGRWVDERYRFKNQTLIEWLEITSAEQRKMTAIVDQSEAQRRDTERARLVRRKAGCIERGEYLRLAEHRLSEALRLRENGRTWAEVASALGYASAKSAQMAASQRTKKTESAC
jgi:hypothetical protein